MKSRLLAPFSFLIPIVFLAPTPTIFGQTQPFDINREGSGVPLIPISLAGFSGEVQNVLTFDLEIAGFKIVAADAAQYNVTGSNASDVQGQLNDRVTKSVLLASRYPGGTSRSQAHAFADDIVLKVTGKPGISRTKIAFKAENSGHAEIYMADYDGANAKAVTADGALVAAPSWVPGKRMLCYTSYRSGWPDIYLDNMSGERRAIAKYPGLNTSASVSPNGQRVAMILSKDGNPELYVCNIDGTNLKRLTKTIQEDESSPTWSPDGRMICYVSGRALPRLYVIPGEGGEPQRIATAGAGRVTEPDWSPDGKSILFTAQRGGNNFDICVIPAQGGDVVTLTSGEDPSWAPNSRTVVFSRSLRGRKVLSLLDVPTKRVKDVAQSFGGCSQPSWAR
jgi:TolB protein